MTPHELVSETLKLVASKVEPGITTKELDKIGYTFIKKNKGIPFNLNYHPKFARTPFPASLCISVNDQICHGIPSDYKLQTGDLVNLDTGVFIDGKCGDAALSVGVGTISEKDQELLDVAKEALFVGIRKAQPGIALKDLGSAINKYAESRGYVTNRKLCGHGIGVDMHMSPEVPNYYNHNNHEVLKEGMVICIEPQVTKKDREGIFKGDWDYRTRDRKKSAFFEHMLEITSDGCTILTTHF